MLFSNFYNSTHNQWSSDMLDTLNAGSVRLPTDINISNMVISLLLAIFAITIICTLTASILWARSKRRSKRLNQRKDKLQCEDKNHINMKESNEHHSHECGLLDANTKLTCDSKKTKLTRERNKRNSKRFKHYTNQNSINGHNNDKNTYYGSSSSMHSSKNSNNIKCNFNHNSPVRNLTTDLHSVSSSNISCDTLHRSTETNANIDKSPRLYTSLRQKCTTHERTTPMKHFSRTLFPRNKPTTSSVDNNYVALNKLSNPVLQSEQHQQQHQQQQQQQYLLQEHKRIREEDKGPAESESSYLLPCDLLSVCNKHNHNESNTGIYNSNTGANLVNSPLDITQPSSTQIQYLEHNISQHHLHYRQQSNSQQQYAAHLLTIDPTTSMCLTKPKNLEYSTHPLSEGLITCCSTIPIVSTLSRGCPTHGPHLILHHNENSEFTTPTRIFAVSSVLESFKDLTTTVTTTMTTANTSTNSLTKLPGNQLPTTYELRLEPIAHQILPYLQQQIIKED
uniref:Uncharacterized protein n=1 Tax=Trichobilharzia regenti TaxID=157069 RepID=A0AA85JXR6_TRIRE|nr:unnamed protein product [Trichobilharzia regenti]